MDPGPAPDAKFIRLHENWQPGRLPGGGGFGCHECAHLSLKEKDAFQVEGETPG